MSRNDLRTDQRIWMVLSPFCLSRVLMCLCVWKCQYIHRESSKNESERNCHFLWDEQLEQQRFPTAYLMAIRSLPEPLVLNKFSHNPSTSSGHFQMLIKKANIWLFFSFYGLYRRYGYRIQKPFCVLMRPFHSYLPTLLDQTIVQPTFF